MKPSRNQVLVDALAVEIKSRRHELEQTQEDLAGLSGVPRPYISLLEVGKKQPSISIVNMLATGLDISLEELVGKAERRYKKMLKLQAKGPKSSKPAG